MEQDMSKQKLCIISLTFQLGYSWKEISYLYYEKMCMTKCILKRIPTYILTLYMYLLNLN